MPYTQTVSFLEDIFYTEAQFATAHQRVFEQKEISFTLTDNPNNDATLTLGSIGTLVGGYFVELLGSEDFIIPLNTTQYIEIGYNNISQAVTTGVVTAPSIETLDQFYNTVFRVRNISGVLEVLENKGRKVKQLPHRGFIVKDDPVNIGNYELFNFIEDGSFVYTNNIVSVDAVPLINVELKENENYKIISSINSQVTGSTTMYLNNDFVNANYSQFLIRGTGGTASNLSVNSPIVEFGYAGLHESMSEYTTTFSNELFLMTGTGFALSAPATENVYTLSYKYLNTITSVTDLEVRKVQMENNSTFFIYKLGGK